MPDEFWDSQNLFNLREASYLYAGTYPPDDDDPRKPLPPKVANAKRLLEYEKLAGRLGPVLRDLRGPEEFRREDLQRLAERQDHHPATLFPEEQQPAPEGLGNKLLSDTEKGNLLKQIAALAMLLAAKRADLRVGDKPNRKQIAAAVAELLDAVEVGEGGVELDRFGLSSTEFRRNITEGLALLFSK